MKMCTFSWISKENAHIVLHCPCISIKMRAFSLKIQKKKQVFWDRGYLQLRSFFLRKTKKRLQYRPGYTVWLTTYKSTLEFDAVLGIKVERLVISILIHCIQVTHSGRPVSFYCITGRAVGCACRVVASSCLLVANSSTSERPRVKT